MSSTRAPTSSPLGPLYNYVYPAEEGILLGPPYSNRCELPHDWYITSNMDECLQQCEIFIAAGEVYLRDSGKRREDNFHCNWVDECLYASKYDISVRANRKEGAMAFLSMPNPVQYERSYCD